MVIYVLVCHPSFLPSFSLPLIWRSMGTTDLAATYATAKGDLVEWIYLVTPSDTVGVDTMVLIHRFLRYCNRSLILEHDTEQIVAKMVQEAKMMAKYCTPIFFIDSARPYPPKEKEMAARSERRKQARCAVLSILGLGEAVPKSLLDAARSAPGFLKKAVVLALRQAGFTVVVCPYEADAVLAFWARQGWIKHVLTVDSDLLVYNVPSLLLQDTQKTASPRVGARLA